MPIKIVDVNLADIKVSFSPEDVLKLPRIQISEQLQRAEFRKFSSLNGDYDFRPGAKLVQPQAFINVD